MVQIYPAPVPSWGSLTLLPRYVNSPRCEDPMMKFFNVINGQRRSSDDNHQCTDPRSEKPLWDAPLATTNDLDEAVEAAQKALKSWSKTSIEERSEYLRKIVEVFTANKQELMEIVMKETGKSVRYPNTSYTSDLANTHPDSHGRDRNRKHLPTNSLLQYVPIQPPLHLPYPQNLLAKVHLEDEVTFEDASLKIVATHTPLGIVGAICPWNFPLILSNIKIVSSLVTGNCVIVKPSPFTPYSVLKSVELLIPVLPPGVVQVLNGGADLGAAMTTHPGIAKISFTGTVATGKRVMESCARTLKRLTLELAGNDACVVTEDVDVAETAGKVATGCFFNAGQMCVATKRVYVHESVYEPFLEAFTKEVQKAFAVNGDAAAPSLFGPVSNKAQYEVVQEIVRDCEKNGYDVVAAENPLDGKGLWVPPTIVVKPPEDSMLVREEQFGKSTELKIPPPLFTHCQYSSG